MTVDTHTATAAGPVPSPEVVRDPAPGSVVVGLDGSTGSRAALEYGCDEATLRGLPVAAVVAWADLEVWAGPYPMVPAAYDVRGAALDLAREEIATVLRDRAARGASTPRLELVVAPGPPAVVLERLSAAAGLLVVGHRGRGGIATRLLGSVGFDAVVHAHCTVVVVRPPETGTRLAAAG